MTNTQTEKPASNWPQGFMLSIGNGLQVCKGCKGIKFDSEFPTYKNNPNRRGVKCFRCLGLKRTELLKK